MNSIEKKANFKENLKGSKNTKTGNMVVFYFDETLVKSKNMFFQVNRDAMKMLKLPYDDYIASNIFWLIDKEYLGWGRDMLEQRYIFDSIFSSLISRLCNKPYFYKQMKFFNGMKDVIKQLAKSDIKLAIASSRDLSSILNFLAIEEVSDCFDVVQATDGGKVFKDKPDTQILDYISSQAKVDLSKSVMIGDTSGDMIMGKNAGMKTIAVGYGAYTPADKMFELQPDAILYKEENIKALPSIIKGLIESMKNKNR